MHVGIEPPMGMTPQHFHTIPTSCAILPCVIGCVHGRVVEGSELRSAGCVVHVGVHGEWVVLWVAAMQLLLSMAEAVECTSSAESVWHVSMLYAAERGRYLVCRKAAGEQ